MKDKKLNCTENYSTNVNLKSRFVWEKKKHTIVSAGSTTWSMLVKFSIGGCPSNAVVKVSCNCWERTFNIVMIKYLRNGTFQKNIYHNSDGSLSVVSKQKTNMKTRNTMAPSYSKVTSAQNKGVPFFSCLAHGVWYYISMFGLSQSFFNTFSLPGLVEVQHLHENGQ